MSKTKDEAAAKDHAGQADAPELKPAKEPKEKPAKEPKADVATTVRIKKAGATSFGFGAHAYAPDAKGVFTVPAEALDVARAHGFEPA